MRTHPKRISYAGRTKDGVGRWFTALDIMPSGVAVLTLSDLGRDLCNGRERFVFAPHGPPIFVGDEEEPNPNITPDEGAYHWHNIVPPSLRAAVSYDLGVLRALLLVNHRPPMPIMDEVTTARVRQVWSVARALAPSKLPETFEEGEALVAQIQDENRRRDAAGIA